MSSLPQMHCLLCLHLEDLLKNKNNEYGTALLEQRNSTCGT